MKNDIQPLIQSALTEDIGFGDITTEACIDPKKQGKAILKAKQDLVLAGIDIFREVLLTVDSDIKFVDYFKDGDYVNNGDLILDIEGKLSSMLKGERTALNFLQHLSGIATYANRFVEAVKDTDTKILDTRKTLPGYRALEKYAVKMGGAINHRVGLYDQYLIKDNHIAAAGSISKAIVLAKNHRKDFKIKIEVETKNLDEVREAIQSGIDIIMLDNMSLDTIKNAITLRQGDVKFEVSGNVSLQNVADYAKTGVDYISVGAITHSAPAADISMLIV
ncbi:carboxylating nicotinate-nucleotide diphosphorylase [bacterium]|nr:carboxylating nicotinate-nucleotide diphosphorylase [bacterium]